MDIRTHFPTTAPVQPVTGADLPPGSHDVSGTFSTRIADVSNTSSQVSLPASLNSSPCPAREDNLPSPSSPRRNNEFSTADIRRLKAQHPGPSANAEKAMENATPRRIGESDRAYVRRLKKQCPDLLAPDAAAAAKMKVSNIKLMPEFNAPSSVAQAAMVAIPRFISESNINYARRLKKNVPALTVADLIAASGAYAWNVRGLTAFLTPTEASRAAVAAISPRGRRESGIAYARRLKRGTPTLSSRDAAAASGAHWASVRQIQEFRNPKAKVETAVAAFLQKSDNLSHVFAHFMAKAKIAQERPISPVPMQNNDSAGLLETGSKHSEPGIRYVEKAFSGVPHWGVVSPADTSISHMHLIPGFPPALQPGLTTVALQKPARNNQTSGKHDRLTGPASLPVISRPDSYGDMPLNLCTKDMTTKYNDDVKPFASQLASRPRIPIMRSDTSAGRREILSAPAPHLPASATSGPAAQERLMKVRLQIGEMEMQFDYPLDEVDHGR